MISEGSRHAVKGDEQTSPESAQLTRRRIEESQFLLGLAMRIHAGEGKGMIRCLSIRRSLSGRRKSLMDVPDPGGTIISSPLVTGWNRSHTLVGSEKPKVTSPH